MSVIILPPTRLILARFRQPSPNPCKVPWIGAQNVTPHSAWQMSSCLTLLESGYSVKNLGVIFALRGWGGDRPWTTIKGDDVLWIPHLFWQALTSHTFTPRWLPSIYKQWAISVSGLLRSQRRKRGNMPLSHPMNLFAEFCLPGSESLNVCQLPSCVLLSVPDEISEPVPALTKRPPRRGEVWYVRCHVFCYIEVEFGSQTAFVLLPLTICNLCKVHFSHSHNKNNHN